MAVVIRDHEAEALIEAIERIPDGALIQDELDHLLGRLYEYMGWL